MQQLQFLEHNPNNFDPNDLFTRELSVKIAWLIDCTKAVNEILVLSIFPLLLGVFHDNTGNVILPLSLLLVSFLLDHQHAYCN